ncbi:putative GRIP domain protein [Toxoplasma gondii RUB]|uniref:Putative GRIP domain protein n=1 Tax=Toxoplasma gondii RUB TaxID=935652 RepID=A0A086M0X4_TOXGO|nr:putative GRIP domain protein [Toxoplasma gondii RUB]
MLFASPCSEKMPQISGSSLLGALNESPLGASPSSSFLFGRSSSSSQQPSGFSSLQSPAATSAAAAATASLSASAAAASSFFSTLTSTLASGTFPTPSRGRSNEAGGSAEKANADCSAGRSGEAAGAKNASAAADAAGDLPPSLGLRTAPKPCQLFDEDESPARAADGQVEAGDLFAEKQTLERVLRRRERELRAALKRMRRLEEAAATQNAERHQERELLLDVLKQNGLFESSSARDVGSDQSPLQPDPSDAASGPIGRGDLGCTSTRAEDVLTEDAALMGIQKLANLLRQLEEENRVLLLFAQMVFPTYPGFASAGTSVVPAQAGARLASSSTGQQRRPQLDFEDLRTSWLEQEETRGAAAVHAQHAAREAARGWEAQAKKAEQEAESLRATVAELRQQVAKVTKEKAHLLVGRMQRAGQAGSGPRMKRGGDASLEPDLCPHCSAMSTAATRALEAATGALEKSRGPEDAREETSAQKKDGEEEKEDTGGEDEEEKEKTEENAEVGESEDGGERQERRREGGNKRGVDSGKEKSGASAPEIPEGECRGVVDGEETCGVSGRQEKGEVGSCEIRFQCEEDAVPRGDKENTFVPKQEGEVASSSAVTRETESAFCFVSGPRAGGSEASDVCGSSGVKRRPRGEPPSYSEAETEIQESSSRAEIVELRRRLEETQMAFQQHREQARALLGKKEEVLSRLRHKVATLQLRQRQGALETVDSGVAASEFTTNSASALGSHLVDSGALLQEMALRQTQTSAEIRDLQDALQQAREEVLRVRGESTRLRTQLEEARRQGRRSSAGRGPLLGSGEEGSEGEGEGTREEKEGGGDTARRAAQSGRSVEVEEDEGVIRDAQYLRNVLIRYVQYQRGGNEKAAVSLLPVLATVLKMNEEEKRQILESGGTGPLAGAAGALYAVVAQQFGLS